MTKQVARHDIQEGLYVYQQNNSQRWYCRFVLYGKWYSKATKEKDLQLAIVKATRIFVEHEIKADNGLLVDSKRFRDVAAKTIEKLQIELDNGTGKVSYKDYIQALNKYHIPFFDRTYITNINQEKIHEFNKWRIEQFGRVPAHSTLLTHNSAIQMVFKEAIEHKWMIAAQVPTLSSKGESGKRRAAFSKDEFEKVCDTIESMIENSRKEISKQIRELLLSYAQFVAHTGIRPGTEMEEICWGDIEIRREEELVQFIVKVRKGKTTKHTGTRTVVCFTDIWEVLDDLRERFPNRKPQDKVFVLANGDETLQLSNNFKMALEKCGLKDSPDGPRSLYSIRHSYITWRLQNRKIRIDVLAKQCGTSITMIEQHYSHVVPEMFSDELSGTEFKKELEPVHQLNQKGIDLVTKRFKKWEEHYKKYGCI